MITAEMIWSTALVGLVFLPVMFIGVPYLFVVAFDEELKKWTKRGPIRQIRKRRIIAPRIGMIFRVFAVLITLIIFFFFCKNVFGL